MKNSIDVSSATSPNGVFIASVSSNSPLNSNSPTRKLVIRDSKSLLVKKIFNLTSLKKRTNFIRWSSTIPTFSSNGITFGKEKGCTRQAGKQQKTVIQGYNDYHSRRCTGGGEGGNGCVMAQRILLADEETIQIFDLVDDQWTATICQGAALGGFGGIKNVEFGRNADEVIVFSEFQIKVTIWNVATSKHIEIPHPKFPSPSKGFGYRPFTNHFAILTRSSTMDVVSIHRSSTYNLSTSFTLSTVDCQGLKWSPCGRWLAVWESPTIAYRVFVYTADGHLYRTHEKPCEGLGIKTVDWSPGGEFLTIGSFDGKICFLSNYTFSPVISMNHTQTVKLPGVTVWSETSSISPISTHRYYSQVQQPTSLPVATATSTGISSTGISSMTFTSPDGSLIASKNDTMPSTVWIWSLELLRPISVLVHLSSVKSFSWYNKHNSQILSILLEDGSTVMLWKEDWTAPRVVPVPNQVSWVKWIDGVEDDVARIMCGDDKGFVAVGCVLDDAVGGEAMINGVPGIAKSGDESSTGSGGTAVDGVCIEWIVCDAKDVESIDATITTPSITTTRAISEEVESTSSSSGSSSCEEAI